MRLGILTAVWGRPKLTRVYLDRLSKLQDKYDIVGVCVGSNDEFKDYCSEKNIIYTDCENRPLGRKWSHGLDRFKEVDVSHIMIMGSDDFGSYAFYEHAMDYAFKNDKDFCGALDLWMYGGNPRRYGFGILWYFRYGGFLVGPGRIYSRRALEMREWSLWSHGKNAGLDGSAAKSMRLLQDKINRGHWINKEEGVFIIDIKSAGGNISSIPGAAKEVKDGTLYDFLSKHMPEETEKLINIVNEEASNSGGRGIVRSYDSQNSKRS